MASSQEGREPHSRALRQELHQLQEDQRWYHHVVDLNSGRLETAERNGPAAPLTRNQAVARIGHSFDPSIFSGPSYRLTPRQPFNPTPQAWLSASHVDFYSTYDDTIFWQLPQEFPRGIGFSPGMQFSFAISPDDRALVSILVTAHAWQGRTGHVRIDPAWTDTEVRVPIGPQFGTHTLDLVFVPLGGRESHIRMDIEEGVRWLTFHWVTFGREPMVLSPA
jgi:hypothetical protein